MTLAKIFREINPTTTGQDNLHQKLNPLRRRRRRSFKTCWLESSTSTSSSTSATAASTALTTARVGTGARIIGSCRSASAKLGSHGEKLQTVERKKKMCVQRIIPTKG